ncbi:MAG: ABC transporter substrate-binding protein [Pseudomonadota bacterium]
MQVLHTLFILFISLFSALVQGNTKPLIIGLDADMSAVAIEGGLAIKRGAQLAINEINRGGGVLGRPLLLDVRDHRGNPARGLANIRYFSQKQDVVAVLGGVHTPVALHELDSIHANKMIYLGPWAAGTPIVDNGFKPNYVFRLSVRDEHAGDVLMRYAQSRTINTVGLLLERTGWGRSNERSMERVAADLNITIAGKEWFNWREKTMSASIERLLALGAEAILLVANAPEGAVIVNNMAALPEQKRIPIFSHWGIASGSFVNQVGLENLQKVDLSVLQTYSFLAPNNPKKSQSLLAHYQSEYDKTITAKTIPAAAGVVHAYDLVNMLAKAITKAGSSNRQKIRQELENLQRYEGVFKVFNNPFSDQNHDALTLDDYIMASYSENGFLVPVN